jgi:putative cell wall-binding protein
MTFSAPTPDRDATANLISQAMFPTPHSAHVVILARDNLFADALAGSPMSKVFVGPVLLTPSTSLSASARDGIVRALNPGDTVYILGGTAAISDNVEAQIRALGFVTVRIGGAGRYATAALIATKLATAEVVTKVYFATGVNFPDALAGAAYAAQQGWALLLVRPGATSVPGTQVTYLQSVASSVTSVVILGGINAMPDAAANLVVDVLQGK